MKKYSAALVILLIIVCAWLAIPLVSDGADKITIIYNGKELKSDMPPMLSENRVLVPIRVVSEELGYDVEYNPEGEYITIENKDMKITLQNGNSEAEHLSYLEYSQYQNELDVPAKIVNGRTYVPLRYVSSYMGCAVDWVEKEKKVVITPDDSVNVEKDEVFKK